MQEQALTPLHRARLEAQAARAREHLEARTRHAVETMSDAPRSDPDDPEMALYHKGGKAAFFFCIWVAMIAPIVLFITLWD